MPKHRLTREVPEQVPAHSSFNIEQDDLIYQFIAFFVPEDKYYIHRLYAYSPKYLMIYKFFYKACSPSSMSRYTEKNR